MPSIVVSRIKDHTGGMQDGVIFIGTFQIPTPGAWLPAIQEMSAFVEANVPRVHSFHAYVSDDGTEGTVIYVHPDADSFDQHLAAAAELIDAGTAMVEVTGIALLGQPNAGTVERLQASGLPVTVKAHVTGFAR